MGRGRFSALLLSLLPFTNGCLVRTRTNKRGRMPGDDDGYGGDLVKAVNDGCEAMQSLSATHVSGTAGGTKNGKEKTYTSFNGYILLRKPESLRVIGLIDYLDARVRHGERREHSSCGFPMKIR